MAYCQSYTPDYFALNDILSTEERVSCKIEIQMLGLGNYLYIITFSIEVKLSINLIFNFPLIFVSILLFFLPIYYLL